MTITGKGGARHRGIPRPNQEDLPFGRLAARLWDELYAPVQGRSLDELANMTGKKVSRSTVRNIFSGEAWRWPSGEPLIIALDGDPQLWEKRFLVARQQEDQRRSDLRLQPLPFQDEEDSAISPVDRAVDDWNTRRLLSRRRRLSLARLSVAIAATAISLVWLDWTIGVAIAAVGMSGELAWRRIRRRAADDSGWHRRTVLCAFRDRAIETLHYSRVTGLQAHWLPQKGLVQNRDDAMGCDSLTVRQLFDDASEALVLISDPGLGKSYQLANLTLRLVEEQLAHLDRGPDKDDAASDWWDRVPLPVLLRLDTYRGQAIDDWISVELGRQYNGYAPELVRSWLQTPGILPLLDGLDEVPEPYRAECVRQLRLWRQRGRGFVITSRSRDRKLVQKIGAKLAVEIGPPTTLEVRRYLDTHASALADVRAALENDKSLWRVLRSPLMLNIILHTYSGQDAPELREPGSTRERQARIFDAYLRRMLNYRPTKYGPEQTLRYLTALARRLSSQGQAVLYLDRLDDAWIDQGFRMLVKNTPRIVTNLSFQVMFTVWASLAARFGAPVSGAAAMTWATLDLTFSLGMVLPWRWKLKGFLWIMAIVPLFAPRSFDSLNQFPKTVTLSWFVTAWAKIYTVHTQLVNGFAPVEQLHWSWRPTVPRALISMFGTTGLIVQKSFSVLGPVAMATVTGIAAGLFVPEAQSSRTVLLTVLLAGMFMFSGEHVRPELLERRSRPNEGIRRSLRFALVAGTVSGGMISLIAAVLAKLLVPGAGLPGIALLAALVGVGSGIAVAFRHGFAAVAYHWALRLALAKTDNAPYRLQHFLHDAEGRVLLYRSGSGFVFPHRQIQDHLDTDLESLVRRLGLASNSQA